MFRDQSSHGVGAPLHVRSSPALRNFLYFNKLLLIRKLLFFLFFKFELKVYRFW